MLSARLNCSKGMWGWAQPTADELWGAQGGLSPSATNPGGYIRRKVRADTPHPAEVCSHDPKGKDSPS